MSQVFGMHNWPGIPAGTFMWRNGPIMAATGEIVITVTGHGAHGAKPNEGIDPILVAAHIVTALQSIVARNMEPTEAGVVTIGTIAAGPSGQCHPGTRGDGAAPPAGSTLTWAMCWRRA